MSKKPNGFWTKDITITKLKNLIENIQHFPTDKELRKMNRNDLSCAIRKHGGLNVFRKLLGYDYIQRPWGYWNQEKAIEDLNPIIENMGHFPTEKELHLMGRSDLSTAIQRNGGFNEFKKLLGYSLNRKQNGFWVKEITINELNNVTKNIGHFPTQRELVEMDRYDLLNAINRNGGINKFRNLLGYTISIYDEYISKLVSYLAKRGKNSEKLIKKIIIEYCKLHNLPLPRYNVKLSKGNIIEFVCNTGKIIGIDVTNAGLKSTVTRKWRKKDYYKHLDELWIVVFSDVFTDSDYKQWNEESPDNVKVMSIYQFLEELDYSLDINTKNKIDKYCSCTFHTKEELMGRKETVQKSLDIDTNTKYFLNTYKNWRCTIV